MLSWQLQLVITQIYNLVLSLDQNKITLKNNSKRKGLNQLSKDSKPVSRLGQELDNKSYSNNKGHSRGNTNRLSNRQGNLNRVNKGQVLQYDLNNLNSSHNLEQGH